MFLEVQVEPAVVYPTSWILAKAGFPGFDLSIVI
jgi:hypothetical protein